MPKDHFLPASLIGRFSDEQQVRAARDRRIYVLRKGRKSPDRTRAENVGYVNDLYKVSGLPWGEGLTSIDPYLHGYESGLPDVLDTLEEGFELSLEAWLRVAVPYVAATFTRGSEFIQRFMARISLVGVGELNTADNANRGRFIEFERLLAPVCCARWIVMHKRAGESFTINDLGMTGTLDLSSGKTGWALPIGRNSVLGIFPLDRRTVACYSKGAWKAVIEHREVDPREISGLNDSMSNFATSFAVGPEPVVLERIAPIAGTRDKATALLDAWPTGREAKITHAHEWRRLIYATAGNPRPTEITDLQRPSGTSVEGWLPPLTFVINAREFPTGLTLTGNCIRLDLGVPDNYGKYFNS